MLTTEAPTPITKVQWWDSERVHVLCPFCEEIHRHGFTGYGDERLSRVAHCKSRLPGDQTYVFKFPPAGCFYIDKTNICFVTDGVKLPEHTPPERLNELRARFQDAINRKPLWKGLGREQAEEIDNVVGKMVLGSFDTVRRFLDNADTQLRITFLTGVEPWNSPPPIHDSDEEEDDSQDEEQTESRPTYGKTILHYAASERYPEIVKVLLEEGACVNSVDLDGRTPLMEAALWGRLENVQVLLEHGADATLPCIKDNKVLYAADFARLAKQIQHTRGQNKTYSSYEMEIRGREIVRLLSKPPTRQPALQLENFYFSRSSDDQQSLSLKIHYNLPTRWKTVAHMVRDGNLPPVSAMSGWGHGEHESIQIAGRDWTCKVLELCNAINFTPEPHYYDKGVPGRYNACHAEKQLIAYFVDKHCFLDYEMVVPSEPPDELSILRDMMCHTGFSEEAFNRRVTERIQEEDKLADRSRLVALKEIFPPDSLPKADIVVSQPVCDDCEAFIKHVNTQLGLSLRLLTSTMHVVEGEF
ncbi:ankyrin repeat-containing protein [Fusarium beomiforme]|uniref:Ankyrin repeat-containing protein n=1 Tax=Fusarium beomiforme TaxID=44412 RepID=A0A9P5ANB9_9HYPO|nr:ankyrin repeat-containing protein [Fusarium beomiforme]